MITEKIQTKITDTCDVLVCGGGFAGIAAALAAARQGKKVILLEKEYMLGGLGTAGLITIYLPICDGMGRQVSFGIAEELLRLSISMGAEARYPENWLDGDDPAKRTENDPRFMVRYNAQLFAILAEQLLIKEQVKILYGSYAVAVDRCEDRINAVMIENKSGRQAIKAKSVVDATGDCDIAHFAGAPTENYKKGNLLAAWYYYADQKGFDLKQVGASDDPYAVEKKKPLVKERFSGLDGDEISRMMQLSHGFTLDQLKKQREYDPTTMPVTIASIPQLRMTRKLVGEYVMDLSEEHTYFEDSIGLVSNWRKRGPVYEVPFRTLYSKHIKNLIVAGRCSSVTDDLWEIMRVIPCCAVMGQAAGTAAAMTDDFAAIDLEKLQNQLKKDGVILHCKDL